MKTQLSKPSCSKARYTEEYKKEALELWRNSGRSAAKLGILCRSQPRELHSPATAGKLSRLFDV